MRPNFNTRAAVLGLALFGVPVIGWVLGAVSVVSILAYFGITQGNSIKVQGWSFFFPVVSGPTDWVNLLPYLALVAFVAMILVMVTGFGGNIGRGRRGR